LSVSWDETRPTSRSLWAADADCGDKRPRDDSWTERLPHNDFPDVRRARVEGSRDAGVRHRGFLRDTRQSHYGGLHRVDMSRPDSVEVAAQLLPFHVHGTRPATGALGSRRERDHNRVSEYLIYE